MAVIVVLLCFVSRSSGAQDGAEFWDGAALWDSREKFEIIGILDNTHVLTTQNSNHYACALEQRPYFVEVMDCLPVKTSDGMAAAYIARAQIVLTAEQSKSKEERTAEARNIVDRIGQQELERYVIAALKDQGCTVDYSSAEAREDFLIDRIIPLVHSMPEIKGEIRGEVKMKFDSALRSLRDERIIEFTTGGEMVLLRDCE